MLEIAIPGRKTLHLEYLLLDLNGTITTAGGLINGVKEKIGQLQGKLEIFLLTADTYGLGREIADELEIRVVKVSGASGGVDKSNFLNSLGAEKVVAIGNGFNDRLMLAEAELSVAIIGAEGCCLEALMNSDIVVKSIADALDLLINPIRIIATLRA